MSAQISSLPEVLIPGYLYRPSEEYRLSLNWIASKLQPLSDELLAVCSSAFYLNEVLKRWPGHISIMLEVEPDGPAQLEKLSAYACASLTTLEVNHSRFQHRFHSILWAEPQRDGRFTIEALNRLAAPNALLAVISSGGLRTYLPEWQAAATPTPNPLALPPLLSRLKRAGWVLQEQRGYHGLRSIFLSVVARLAGTFNQPAADRLGQFSREYYQEAGLFWRLSPVRALLARHVA